jgi:integrase
MAGSLVIKGNKYYAKFRVNGKQKLLATGINVKGNNKRKAEKVLRELISQYEQLDINKENTLFLSFLDNWLVEIKQFIKPSTWEYYDKIINGKIKPYFKKRNFKLMNMKPSDFSDYFCYLATNGKSKGQGGLCYKSVKNIRSVISSAMEYAVKERYIQTNPVSESVMPVFPDKLETDVPEYNADEVKALLKYAKDSNSHIYVFLLLALFTGLRKGELLALTWDDIDFNNNTLRVNKSRTGTRKDVTKLITTPKTKSSNRTIPLNKFTIDALKNEKAKQLQNKELLGDCFDNSCNYIVRNIDGKPYSNLSAINRVVNRLTEKAGLPHCTIHGFRHSVASILDESGVPLQDISVLLGHEYTSTTERIYIKRRNKAKTETINILDSVINLN